MKIQLDATQMIKVRKTVEDTVAKFIDDLPHLINRRLEAIVAQCLGLTERWGKWEVDNSNGRNSTVSSYLSQKARDHVETTINKVGENFALNDAQVKALEKDLKQRIDDSIRRSMWKLSEAKAQEILDEHLAKIEIDLDVIDMSEPTLDDMSDPSFGVSLLEQVHLKSALKENM